MLTPASTESRTATAGVPGAPKSIYEVVLDGQYQDNVPVHESCDQVSFALNSLFSSFPLCNASFLALSQQTSRTFGINTRPQVRRKIHAHLAQPGVTKAQFCRDMDAQLYSSSAPKKIQSKMLDDFLKKHGASHGCTSSVYYAVYVFFEKWRIVRNDAKSKHRLEMEKIWPIGVERDRDDTTKG